MFRVIPAWATIRHLSQFEMLMKKATAQTKSASKEAAEILAQREAEQKKARLQQEQREAKEREERKARLIREMELQKKLEEKRAALEAEKERLATSGGSQTSRDRERVFASISRPSSSKGKVKQLKEKDSDKSRVCRNYFPKFCLVPDHKHP